MAGVANRQDRLAKILNAKHVSDTNSGHVIQMEQPQLVVDAIREVVEAVRRGNHQVVRNEKDTELLPKRGFQVSCETRRR